MSLIDKIYKSGLQKVVDATIAAETIMTEARDAYEAEKARKEKEEMER